MKQHEILHEYLSALYKAEVDVTDDLHEPLHFNEAESLAAYRIDLLDVEIPAISCLMDIREKGLEDNAIIVAMLGTIIELETILGEENGHATHRYLQITHEGLPLPPEELTPDERELLDEYLRLQRASFRHLARWFNTLKTSVSFPCTLRADDMDIAEMMALHLHTSLVVFPTDKYLIKEFILYFCHVWNLPATKDYYTIVSHALARPHPTAFLEKIVRELQNYIETLDRKRI